MTTGHQHQNPSTSHVVEAVTAVSDAMVHLVEALRTGDTSHMRACQNAFDRAHAHVDQLEGER